MTPFESSLTEEEQWLCIITGERMPSDYLSGKRVYIGPCMLPLIPWQQRLLEAGFVQMSGE